METNSKFYSALPPARLRDRVLPHITIQCPVYKEGLHTVIAPTVRSIKQAISTYELQGGSANMFINDDGIQLISEEDRKERIEFYADNNIGWVGRPKHGVDGFLRRGKFKKVRSARGGRCSFIRIFYLSSFIIASICFEMLQWTDRFLLRCSRVDLRSLGNVMVADSLNRQASNMNYALMISCRVEEKLAQVNRSDGWTQHDEAFEYDRCLKEVLEEEGRAWADGNIRLGDYILLSMLLYHVISNSTRRDSCC